MIDINKFLQLNNPDIARQTRNMSYFDALKSEIPGTKSYQGYNPFYKGADKTGLSGYLKQGIDSVQGKFKPGSNVGGATPLTRKLAQDAMRLGIGASSIGRSALARTVGTFLGGTVAGTAGILTSPYIAIANHLYGPNVGKAQDFVGMFGEAMPFSGDADMYPEFFSNLGKQGTSAEPPTGIMNIETPKGFDYNFDENVLKEEEDAQYNLDNKRSFNMDGIVQNLKNYLPFIGDKSITGTLTRGIGQFFNNIGDRIPNTPQYQQYTPGYNYGNLNPNLIDDFYDPATGLNRFDRAKTLFGQSRTLSEFLSKRRERAAAEADLIQRREIERKLEREKALARNTSSNIDYGGFVSGGGTHSSDSSFTGHSSATGGGMGQSGWGGPRADGGFIGQYSNGGLATMFRRKQ